MKKIIVLIIILLLISSPIWAMGVAIGAGVGLALGASTAAALGAATVGAVVVGGIVGAVAGAGVGAYKQDTEEKEKKQVYEANIASLNLSNTELESRNKTLSTALDAWGADYDSNIAVIADEGERELRSRKESWGLTDATLAAQERGGMTARLLSLEAKNRVITYAGEDMELNSSEIEKAVADAFNAPDTSSLRGLTSSNYGIYEKQLITTMTTLRSNKQSLEETIKANKEAIAVNNESIKKYKDLEDDLFFN